jgi:hypothetical protein
VRQSLTQPFDTSGATPSRLARQRGLPSPRRGSLTNSAVKGKLANNTVSVVSPDGWACVFDASGVTWTYTGAATCYIDSPALSFSLHSAETEAVVYGSDNPYYPSGTVGGSVYAAAHDPLGGGDLGSNAVGFERFSFLGPVPEPQAARLILAGAAAQSLASGRRTR